MECAKHCGEAWQHRSGNAGRRVPQRDPRKVRTASIFYCKTAGNCSLRSRRHRRRPETSPEALQQAVCARKLSAVAQETTGELPGSRQGLGQRRPLRHQWPQKVLYQALLSVEVLGRGGSCNQGLAQNVLLLGYALQQSNGGVHQRLQHGPDRPRRRLADRDAAHQCLSPQLLVAGLDHLEDMLEQGDGLRPTGPALRELVQGAARAAEELQAPTLVLR
mmetsp:Transcript_20025/g.55800  ORF Transcript_20025/g.55800 Transcript_20025/m.55800 type:complete len:219 (-) Transcript_20025:1656-2312(-)